MHVCACEIPNRNIDVTGGHEILIKLNVSYWSVSTHTHAHTLTFDWHLHHFNLIFGRSIVKGWEVGKKETVFQTHLIHNLPLISNHWIWCCSYRFWRILTHARIPFYQRIIMTICAKLTCDCMLQLSCNARSSPVKLFSQFVDGIVIVVVEKILSRSICWLRLSLSLHPSHSPSQMRQQRYAIISKLIRKLKLLQPWTMNNL